MLQGRLTLTFPFTCNILYMLHHLEKDSLHYDANKSNILLFLVFSRASKHLRSDASLNRHGNRGQSNAGGGAGADG